jgi:hypothetical protein
MADSMRSRTPSAASFDKQVSNRSDRQREVYFVEHERVAENDPFRDIASPATPARERAAAIV